MRLFIGVDLPVNIKQALVEFQSELRVLGINGFFKSQDNFHITLEFLGEIDPNSVSSLSEIISETARNHNPFGLNILGLGAFPSFKRPHTVWTGVNGDTQQLHRVRDDLHTKLKNKGFKLEERQFKPHITLVSRPKIHGLELSNVQREKIGEFPVEEITLFESKAVGGKRVYSDLFKVRLRST